LNVSGGYASITITTAKTSTKCVGKKREMLGWSFIAKSKLLLWTYRTSSQVVKKETMNIITGVICQINQV